MKKIQGRSKVGAVIPTASMADIAFLLIIFFMVTTSHQVDKTTVNLPTARIRQEAEKEAAIVVMNKENDGQLTYKFSDGESQSHLVGGPDDIYLEASRLTNLNSYKQFALKADGSVHYEKIDELLDQMRRGGVSRVLLLTDAGEGGAMKLRKDPPEAEIPTSSMADIAFLLIIFFMVTAVFAATKGLDFKLPKQEDNNAPPDTEEAVFIKVNADASVLVDCRPMDPEEIPDYLEPKLSRNPEKPVILYTDPYAPYQAMINVYDVIGSAGNLGLENNPYAGYMKIKNISVPTQTEVAEYIQIFGANPFETQCQ